MNMQLTPGQQYFVLQASRGDKTVGFILVSGILIYIILITIRERRKKKNETKEKT
jgi:hypothetical protein